jgi:cation diffusion facilitator family transporter
MHAHSHGAIDPSIVTHERGLWAVKWSFVILILTGVFQLFVVIASRSVALLGDTVHNFADAGTAIPLGIAFLAARLKPSRRFTYGYGRVEDLAGIAVVFIILFSAIFAGYEAIQRFFHPVAITHLWALVAASIIGFLANEGVAIFRIRVGKEIGSVALIADGYHARVDGWTSLAVLVGATGVWLGFPLADPIIGLAISITIFFIVWQSAKEVFTRILDGVDPEVLDEVAHAAEHVEGVRNIGSVKARWVGHKLYVELNVAVSADASVKEGHDIAKKVHRQLLHHLPHLKEAMIHIDPENQSLPSHSHE